MAGAGFKTFNTGDVLTASDVNTYLMQQTVMVFASAAARTTALGANVAEGMISYLKDTNAVEVYDGSNWVSSDDPNAIQNTIVDAKGDIITATAADTPARLAVGSNGQTLVADSSQTTGLRWSDQISAAGKNAVINGGFDIWQRATTGTLPAGTFTGSYVGADRWKGATYNGSLAATASRQTTSDTTNLPNIQYCARIQRNSGNTTAAKIAYTNVLESVNSTPFAGQTVVISFYARRGANYSSASNALTAIVYTGTGTDQGQPDAFTGVTAAITGTATLTTTWQRFSYTGTLSASLNQIGVWFEYTTSGTAGADDYFEITGVQLELGSSATPFSRAGGTIQGELAACQRYYYRWSATDTYSNFGLGTAWSTTLIRIPYYLTMRTAPTTIDSGGNFRLTPDGSSSTNVTALGVLSTNEKGANNTAIITATVASGLTQYRPYMLTANADNTAYFGLSAEL